MKTVFSHITRLDIFQRVEAFLVRNLSVLSGLLHITKQPYIVSYRSIINIECRFWSN